MRINQKAGVVCIIVLVLFMCPIRSSNVFPIAKDPWHQNYPAIYGNIVVWQELREINGDIYGYNVSTGQKFPIATEGGHQSNPAIHGDIVVWEEATNDMGWGEIFGYNLSTHQKFRITKNQYRQQNPAIHGKIVVWEDGRDSKSQFVGFNIYGFDLSTGREFQITANKSGQYQPAIYRNIVVWQDNRNGNWDIFGYDLSANQEFQITTNQNNQTAPAVYGNTVVWVDERNNNHDIYGYNLSTHKEFPISTNRWWQFDPAIYENIVVWRLHYPGDIYGYDLSTNKEFPVATTHSAKRCCLKRPAIYGDIVVFEGWEDLRYHIYGCKLSEVIPPDKDGDGFVSPDDCNDNNPKIHPGAKEICDRKDNNCNGRIDEGYDKDGDGYTGCGGDCNDYNAKIHPGAKEPCGSDYNCDGHITPCTQNLETSDRLRWPVWPFKKAHPISLAYGDYDETLHDGIDISCEKDTIVYAVESGKVVKHGNDGDWDEYVAIKGEHYTIVYMHIDATVSEGKDIVIGEDWEKDKGIIGIILSDFSAAKEFGIHLHFSIRNPNNIDEAVMNPLLVLDPAPNDRSKPKIGEIRFRENERDEWWDHNNNRKYMSPDEFLDINNLHGKIDIVVEAHDFNIGGQGPMHRTGVYKIGYEIFNSSGSIVERRILIVWDNEKWDDKALPTGYCKICEEVNEIYEQPFGCCPDVYREDYPWTTLKPQHQMCYIVTNTEGSGKIQKVDRSAHWDTRDYPNGKYKVLILAWDAQNNRSELPVDVIVNNSWLDYIFNIIDEIMTFFFSLLGPAFTDVLSPLCSYESFNLNNV